MISLNATIFVQIINLLVLIWILNRIMYRPLRAQVAQRVKAVQGGMAEAKAAAAKATEREKDYLQQLRRGRKQIGARLATLREETENQTKMMIAETQDKAREDYRQFLEQVQSEIDQARVEIQAEAEAVAKSMVRLVLGREVS